MADDAEWIEVDKEFGPVPDRRTTTRRPFWLTTPSTATRPSGPPTVWPPRYPYTTPDTPYDQDERALPQPLQPDHTHAIVFGSLGAVLLLALLGLVAYMVILRRKLLKAQAGSHRTEDYSKRAEDANNFSSPINDSSHLYANTDDLHKLVSSVKSHRRNPPPIPQSEHSGREKCLVPGEAAARNPLPPVPRKPTSAVDRIKRISGRLSAIGVNLHNSWKLARDENVLQMNAQHQSSMPDVVNVSTPEVLDDDDIWSEDSFDSCSIGYENETEPVARENSIRRSSQLDSKTPCKKLSPPCIPPPPPPIAKPILSSGDKETVKPPTQDNSSCASYGNGVPLRKAPAPPLVAASAEDSSPIYGNIDIQSESGISHTAIEVPQTTIDFSRHYDSPRRHNDSRNISLAGAQAVGNNDNSTKPTSNLPDPIKKPLLPPGQAKRLDNYGLSATGVRSEAILKPAATGKVTSIKPNPPTAPKPMSKPNLPKLKMNLLIPQKLNTTNEATPDTALTFVSGTPIQEESLLEDRPRTVAKPNLKPEISSKRESFDPTNLSISARRALMEKKTVEAAANKMH
ncbi:uncharacterized protein LOC108666793 [Hyalella azteca]|uniref:Uncharacterized protein LOC108666793 n=1 Tax=Hyalella azteca TaxID=294128 RepID=A0A8B7N7G6_HYAAZ|nr:uncharacterized protein LOC108666793 [Hyalella azteca]